MHVRAGDHAQQIHVTGATTITTPTRESLDLQFSLSDRIRYYWPHPQIQRAYESLLARLRTRPLPLTLLSQFLPHQYESVRAGKFAGRLSMICFRKVSPWRCAPICGLADARDSQGVPSDANSVSRREAAELEARGADMDGSRNCAAADCVAAGGAARRA